MGLPQKLGADGNHRLRVDVISKWRYCPRLSVIGDRTRGLDREVIKTEPGGEEQCTDVMKIDRPDDLADIASQGPRCRRSKISSIRRPPVLNRTRATLDGVSDIKAYISTWALGLKLAMRSVGLPLGGPVRQSFCPLTRCASAFPDILGVTAQRSFGGPTPPLMSSGAHRPRKYPKGSQMFALSVV
jgi:hypothetical protein